MTLEVFFTPKSITATVVTFVVPGHQLWVLRSIHADVHRAAGGAPNRGYVLKITDGTTTVIQVGAGDAGTEPGTMSLTFADVPASSTAAGAVGTVVAPLAALKLYSGYVITLTILNPAGADAWLDAAVWADWVENDPA